MSSITDVRAALATALTSISGLRVNATVLDSITPPAAIIGEVEIDFDKAFQRGLDELRFKVRVYASRADVSSGQRILDGFLATSGATSVKEALEDDRTLGGVAETLIVRSVSGYGAYSVADVTYLGAEFGVTVWVRG